MSKEKNFTIQHTVQRGWINQTVLRSWDNRRNSRETGYV